jgi:MscS family membrane protein
VNPDTLDGLLAQIPALPADPVLRGAIIGVAFLVLALVVRLLVKPVLHRLTSRTDSDLDDRLADHLIQPAFWATIAAGLWFAQAPLALGEGTRYWISGALLTVIIVQWSVAILKVGMTLLEALSQRPGGTRWVQPATQPLFEIVLKFVLAGGAVYFVCVAWDIPVTSWLASAGIIGIAVGFAAKDTLANLFSGVFILVDAPYKIGDYIILGNGLRGKVLDIGVRSTRILTRDDIEVTVPNAIIANEQIVNETGGPYDKMRVRLKISAAYGSDIDEVERVLLSCCEDVEHLAATPAPRVRFRAFGASGLDFELLAWINEPVFRGLVLHNLHRIAYKAFNEAGLEIPYNKQDVYVKELPGSSVDDGE